ncbi:MAG TPA: NAD-dependent epimerase/dehydratase family protein [Blastocatellia bacterium]|nr:NAD-dependent epimerase/dehydratase family protein [Blastocatellia bacterium]
MNVLIIGGTHFIGPRVARRLIDDRHSVTLFHRGQTETNLPASVRHIYGDRRALSSFASEFKEVAPDIVLDMICYNEREASDLMRTFKGIAKRVVVASSMDVYKAYGCLLGLDSGPPDPNPLNEKSPLRESRFTYRAQAKGPDDMAYDYDKIPVEQAVLRDADLAGTVLRLPAVYGPGDHRLFEYLKRMDDGRPFILLERNHAGWRWTRGHVENVAHALALAVADDRASNRIFNVGEKDALTEAEWVREIGRAAGWRGEVVTLPKELMPEHLALPYNFDHHLQGETSSIRSELGYSESVSRVEALRETVDWERAHPPEQLDGARFDYAAEDSALERTGSRKDR